MKTRTASAKTLLTAATAAGMFLLAGCFSDPSSPSGTGSGDMTATVEGRVQGDMALGKRSSASTGIEGATVTVMRIQSDGSLKAVSTAEARTDVRGRFSVRAAADGARELVVVARKAGKEWKAVVSAKAEQGATLACRPLDTESSLEADVLARVRSGSGNAVVSFADIASHIDAETAFKAAGKAEAAAYLSAQFRTEAQARIAVLTTSSGKATLAQIGKADEARMDAEAKLESRLDAAVDLSAEEKAGIDSGFRAAGFKAWSDAGIVLGEFAKAEAAAYEAMVRTGATASVEAGTRLAWLHCIALEHAAILEAAVEEDVKASGGRSGIAADAGASLKASLNAAGSETGIDSAFAAFRASVSAALMGYLETGLGSKAILSDSSKAGIELESSLNAAATADQVADAYGKFYVSAEAEIGAQISGSTVAPDSAKADALTRAVLLVGIQGEAGAGLTPTP